MLIIDNPSASWLAKVFCIAWPLNHSLYWRQVWILICGSWTLHTCSFRDLGCACTCSVNMQSFSKIQRFYFLRAWAEIFSSGIFTLTLSNRFNYFDIVSIDYFPNNFCFLRSDWQSRQTFLWDQVFLLNPILPLSFQNNNLTSYSLALLFSSLAYLSTWHYTYFTDLSYLLAALLLEENIQPCST